jgi:formiminotetrahydrofolate cyclodeaminase
MTPLTEQAEEYAAENAPAIAPLEVKLRRAYMAGALEAARHKPHDVIRECLDYAKTIGTAAERAKA